MSQQVLARKFRPRNFSDMVGQEHIVTALSNSLKKQRLHHAYLFTGTRGVGKTTLARIIAKAISCETGITPNPCEKCPSCKQISSGCFIDLFEIDAASHTKVDETKEIINKAMYPPSQGRFRIFIIDEVHMLSKHSFNSLLKTLEEPPQYVKFILATTNPEKLPDTIISRCLQFHLASLSPATISEHLANILEQEKISYEPEALDLVATNANGSIRDSLSILEPIITFSDEKITAAIAGKVLGVIPQNAINTLITLIVEDNKDSVWNEIKKITEQTTDPTTIIKQMLSTLHSLSVAQVVPEQAKKLSPMLQNLLSKTTPNQIQLYYQIALKGLQDLPYCPAASECFEMICIRMLAFKLDNTEPKISSSTTIQKAPIKNKASQPVHNTQKAPIKNEPIQSVQNTQTIPAQSEAPTPESWSRVIDQLDLKGMTLALIKNTSLNSVEGSNLNLDLNKSQSALFNDQHKKRIEDALEKLYQKAIKITVNITNTTVNTPIIQAEQKKTDLKQKAKQEMLANNNVQSIMSEFGATISDVTVANE